MAWLRYLHDVSLKIFSKKLKSLLPFTVYNAAAPEIDKLIMLATNVWYLESQGMFSMKDTKVSIKSAAERLKQNVIIKKLSGFQSNCFERGYGKKMKMHVKTRNLLSL